MDREEFVADDLLESAVQFTSSPRFREPIDNFIQTHAHTFHGTADSKSPESAELPHEYNVLFGEYQNLVDSLFDQLAKSRGFTTKALYSCFRDAGEFHSHVAAFQCLHVTVHFHVIIHFQRTINSRRCLRRMSTSGLSTRL